MSLKGQMHNYRMKYTGEGISLTLVRSWTYDTMTISWGGVQVMDKSDPINLPVTVTVALRHKIMTRRIAQHILQRRLGRKSHTRRQRFKKNQLKCKRPYIKCGS